MQYDTGCGMGEEGDAITRFAPPKWAGRGDPLMISHTVRDKVNILPSRRDPPSHFGRRDRWMEGDASVVCLVINKVRHNNPPGDTPHLCREGGEWGVQLRARLQISRERAAI